jgi:uncharacterized protein (DUF1800 family)
MIPGPDTAAAIATSRFGFGARPGELTGVAGDPRGWLLEQVRKPYQPSAELDGLATGQEALSEFLQGRAERQAARKDARNDAPDGAAKPPDPVQARLRPLYQAHAEARTRIALASPDSFRERLVHFWANHFAVSVDKQICLAAAGALEMEAIRPHVGGRFADMLLAVETHPAMVTYLDNQQSVGPHSEFATRRARRARFDDAARQQRIGLNENLAREILELHTLGVDGGYHQSDVTTFAAVITGWSIGGGEGRLAAGTPGAFVFRAPLHEPGAKTLLGRRYADDGFAQGTAVLRDLAEQPATARHLATKLARHFVADEPPAALVDALAHAYLSRGGELGAMYATLVGADAAWDAAPRKFKTPVDFIYSSLRALDGAPRDPKQLLASFELLGQRHWGPGSPAGWPDREQDWDGADALMQRIEWSVALADRVGNARSAHAAADGALGPLATPSTRSALAHASSGAQALALLLMSPEFQRR